MSCMDVGCGGGDVTRELARRVGERGRVLGLDLDDHVLQLARDEARREDLGNIEFRRAEAEAFHEPPVFDLIYARFLLTHVRDRARTLRCMIEATRPGGTLVLEDIDFGGHFCHPPCRAFLKYVEIYQQVVQRRGGDPDIGPKLPEAMWEAGLSGVSLDIVQPAFLEGTGKTVAAITMERIADSVIVEGLASPGEISDVIEQLKEYTEDLRTVLSLPRVFQCLGETQRRGANLRSGMVGRARSQGLRAARVGPHWPPPSMADPFLKLRK